MSVSRSQTVLAAGGLAALLAAGSVAVVLTGRPSSSGSSSGTGRISSVAFTGFDDCSALLSYYRTHGRDLVGPYGLPGAGMMFADAVSAGPALAPMPAAGVARAAAGDSAVGSATGESQAGSSAEPDTGTNVQVAGVDEADVAKRSGELLLTVGAPPGPVMYPTEPGGGPGGSASLPGRTRTAVPPGLRILRMSGNRATLVGVLPTSGWTAGQLLVKGSTVLLLGSAPYGPGGSPDGMPVMPYRSRTRIAQVDIADPAHPKLVRTLDVDGDLVGARLTGGVTRVAVTSSPGDLHLVTPQSVAPQSVAPQSVAPQSVTPQPVTPQSVAPQSAAPGSATPKPLPPQSDAPAAPDSAGSTQAAPTGNGEADALATNRRRIAESSLDQWLPQYSLVEGSGTSTASSGRLLNCTKVAAPTQFSGLNTLALLTFDLGRPAGIGSWDSAGVVATGATMYATADHTYLATSPWQDWNTMPDARRAQAVQQQRTWIHAFDSAGGGSPRYLASGSVPGFLLNQYAMDEYRGVLRVASTTHPSWFAVPGPVAVPVPGGGAAGGSGGGSAGVAVPNPVRTTPAPDTSQVTVLRRDGNRLTQVGSVGGIGRGEQIRAVRFIGPVGYVVTFRQTDPLFTVDLSDPAAPRVAGELKLLGYSAYLHPAGEGRLLGVGQSADANGVREGLQLSLFDVSNPAAPRRLAQVGLSGAFSEVESTPHAFSYVDGLVLVPYSRPVPVPLPRTGAAVPGAKPAPTTEPAPEPDVAAGRAFLMYGLDTGVLAVRVTGNGLSAPTRLHALGPSASPTSPQVVPGRWYATGSPLRTFVVGGAIWTVTVDGVGAHQESTLRWLSFTPFRR